MEIYLVGGAVRDQLLGRPVKERDWVVVGATPEIMLAQGFRPIGKEFPVFLHPQTHEEYALARTERKVSKGYAGFEFYAAPEVTLEEDLKRRDLTVNAMAQTLDGIIIDPYGGQKDLADHILRHVSSAFAEDPVRILRVARFAARFDYFHLYPETLELMRQMVQNGEVNALVPERVWQELMKALAERHPERFFEILNDCGALQVLFPEIQPILQEIKAALDNAAMVGWDSIIRFSGLFYHCDIAATRQLCDRYRAPTDYRELAILVSTYHDYYEKVLTFGADILLSIIEGVDAFRRPERFEKFLAACESNQKGIVHPQSQRLRLVYETAVEVPVQPLIAKGYTGKAIANELQKLRLEAVKAMLKTPPDLDLEPIK